jgi:hypothetical protein
MTVCAEAAGVNMSGAYTNGNAPTTSTMRAKFKATGAFNVLTDKKYLTGSNYLKCGDILVKEGSHTVMVLSNGAKVKSGATKSVKTEAAQYQSAGLAGTYKTTAALNMRAGAGTKKAILCTLPKGAAVRCYGFYNVASGTNWLYVIYNGKSGYCSGKYLKKC